MLLKKMKKPAAWLLTLALLATLFSGLTLPAVADEPAAPEPAALEVYTKTGEAEPVLVKAYSADELAALKETAETGYNYVYWKNGEMKSVVVTEYVALDALLSDAGATFNAGDELKFTCADGPYPKGDFRYEIMAERGYDNEGNAVPSAFALNWGSTPESQASGSIRFVCGATAEELENQSAAGARMPSDVVAVTVVKPAAPEPGNPFSDVAEGTYYFDAVLWAVDNGVTTGTSATTFSPDGECTRAQMVTFLWRAAGSPEPAATECAFSDVEAGSYYEKAVLWAVENGITNGTGEGTFSPDSKVTRAQAVTFLFRLSGADAPAALAVETPFGDVPADAYYAGAVAWAVVNEITNGTSETSFSPDNCCLRGQIVTFLYRYFK